MRRRAAPRRGAGPAEPGLVAPLAVIAAGAALLLAAELLPAGRLAAAPVAPEGARSDTALLAPETRAMQDDDAANPGMLAVLEGEDLWRAPAGPAGRACASCHGEAATSMRGAAARHPAWDEARGAPVDLAGRIDACRTARQGASPLVPEGRERLALTAYVAHQSRGLPVAPPPDAGMRAARERGRALFTARAGGLNLACASCHDDNAGRRLGSATIPQGHPVGYPIYRLEWQSVGSLQRRLRNCLTGMRAEPYPYGAPELIELEAHLMGRAAGLPVETPAVRP